MASLDTTTLVCLFHHRDRAQAAFEDLLKAGVEEQAVTLIGGDGSGIDALDKSELVELEMPDKDYDHLKQGIGAGGTVVAVQSVADHIDTVESIFKKHSAEKIDEADTERDNYITPPVRSAMDGETLRGILISNDELPAARQLPMDETLLVTPTELTSEPFKSAGAPYPGAVRLYRFGVPASANSRLDSATEPDDLDRLP